ncbi:ABC transporter substrate-binding protein [Cryobacterium sp. Hb1]|uniref:ABC transporter substrate-binding protein n=1 Tax=Cryobacterium sp. Hb1 TaxID=1259147 RepID=UPI00106A2CDB|nr:extracellular solute-binding protein [Cryobacterium sp. Hb1]TFD65068.1 extracellular solute-binding protein [Cryobacterium sp. Hb1]
MNTSRRRYLPAVLLVSALGLSGCTSTSNDAAGDVDWAAATSVETGGGLDSLVSAAQAEGTLNVMGLYADWANYGVLIEEFTATYGIEVDNDTSAGSSQDQVNAIKNRVGQSRSLDYLDTGVSFANSASAEGLLAEYRPATVADIDSSFTDAEGMWTNQYGGYVTIGCDAAAVAVCPTSFAQLNDPQYVGKVALTGNPAQGESGFNAVWAAAMATGGSLDDIQPGIEFMAELSARGILIPVEANAGTLETGETPIIINWDYLNLAVADDTAAAGVDFQVVIPTDGTMASYYAASINADAPHPAAARLWIEFMYSDEGQNILLNGYTRPVRFDALIQSGAVDTAAADKLPIVVNGFELPSEAQRSSANLLLAEKWDAAVAS